LFVTNASRIGSRAGGTLLGAAGALAAAFARGVVGASTFAPQAHAITLASTASHNP